MADLHSAARNESPACSCFGRPGTNPGCPAHGNHATPPAVRHQERPTDQGAGETTSGPGWDREWLRRLQHHLPSATYSEPELGIRAAREIDALLADRDRLDAAWRAAHADGDEQAAQRWDLRRQLRETRADLDAALVTIRALQDELATARRDGAADVLDWAADELRDDSILPGTDSTWLAEVAAEVRAGRRTIPPRE